MNDMIMMGIMGVLALAGIAVVFVALKKDSNKETDPASTSKKSMKQCPYCQKEVHEDDVKCKHCNAWFENDAGEKQKEINQDRMVQQAMGQAENDKIGAINEPVRFYAVTKTKFIVMALMTFGFFELVWFYKNYKALKLHNNTNISPFFRAWFCIFFSYTLFRSIHLSLMHFGKTFAKKSAYMPAIFYAVLALTHKLPDPLWLISLLTFLVILPFLEAINENNKNIDPDHVPDGTFRWKDWLGIVIGVLWWGFVVLGMVMVVPEGALNDPAMMP